MGNLCGKESASSTPAGRVLGSASTSPASRQVPVAARPKAKKSEKPKVTGSGRTLGRSASGPSGGGADGEQSQSTPVDARAAAALAAEQRLNNAQKSGKLANQLDQDKRKTQNQHIQDLARTKGQQERLVWD